MSGQLQLGLEVGAVSPSAGARAKADGMAQAEANTTAEWARDCDAAIRTMAARGTVFQAADLVAEGLVGEPDHPNRWGPRFLAARRAGVLEEAGFAQSIRATVHRSICRTWRGAA